MRQGCPLSVVLYIICAETLSNAVKANKNIRGFQIPGCGNKIKLIQYVDDTTQVTSDINSVNHFFEVLDNYAAASSAVIREDKTKGIIINYNKNMHLSKPVALNQALKS